MLEKDDVVIVYDIDGNEICHAIVLEKDGDQYLVKYLVDQSEEEWVNEYYLGSVGKEEN